jgi:hypothetical protein
MDDKQQADALNAALAEEIPEVKAPPSTSVELLRGVFNSETNSWESTAYVRELNGFDEEALASLDNQNVVYSEYMSVLLKRAVVSVGSFSIKDDPTIIDNLIIGDRDLLFLKIIEATYGTNREYQVTCGSCKAMNDIVVPMNEFENRKVDHDPHTSIEATLADGSKVRMRLPNGMDSQIVAKKAKSPAEQNTLMLARCVEVPAMTNPQQWAKELGMKDRNALVQKLMESQPGPEVGEVNAQCATCGSDLNIVLDWASLLFG